MSILVPLASASETRLAIVLLQLAVIIGVARLFGTLFRRFGQPAVVGEIAAGLILGPSVFGKIEIALGYPSHPVSAFIFDPSVADIFSVLSQLGLILLLFLVGLEFDFSHLRKAGKSAAAISAAGVLLPFGLGFALAHAIYPHVVGPVASLAIATTAPAINRGGVHGFALFMGVAMSITALPILGRMMMEFGVTRTRLAAVTISAAAIDDVIGWTLLAAVSAMVTTGFKPGATLLMIAFTILFGLAMAYVVRPIFIRTLPRLMTPPEAHPSGQAELSLTGLAVLLIAIFAAALVTSKIGIFAIFGAFALGATLSDQHAFRAAVSRQMQNFVTAFFLPIFFTYTGLRTNVDSLATPQLWLICAAVSSAAILGKLGGCTLAARATGLTARESLCVGTFMNTRALMELIVINVGYDLGIVPRSVFCMLVFMAVLTTFMTTPLIKRLKTGTELDAPMESTDFRRRPRVAPIAPASSIVLPL